MGRLIDADALLAMPIINGKYDRKNANPHFIYGIQTVAKMIKNAPTVDAVPVVHGEWLLKHVGRGHYWECSVCHANPCIYVTNDTKFCPNCGAKMD